MSDIQQMTGTSPELREKLGLMAQAMSGDMSFRISPQTMTLTPKSEAWQEQVAITLVNGRGRVHQWFDGTVSGLVSVADDSVAGTASVAGADVEFSSGRAVVAVNGDEAAWVDGESATLTLSGSCSVMGVAVSGGTCVMTFSAS